VAERSDLDTRANALATQYSLDVDRVRRALLQAEEFRFWRFRHHGVMKTEEALATEIASLPVSRNCEWLLHPSLEEILAVPRIAPSEWLDLVLNAEPWQVRQRRHLLLDFVPFNDAPFYTLDELADELDGFIVDQNSKALYLAEIGTMIVKPEGEGWARKELGALYQDWPGLPPVCPRQREAILKWRADFIQSHLVPGIRAAAKQGDRGNARAASKLWEASRSRLRDLLSGVEYQDILQREIESIIRQTCIGLGTVTRMALLAAHCSAEIAFGSHRKTRSILGSFVDLDDLHRPRLSGELNEPLDGFRAVLRRNTDSEGDRVAVAVSEHLRRAEKESALLKKCISEYVGLIEETVREAKLPNIDDDILRKQAEERLDQAVHSLRRDYRARIASELKLPLPECPRPLRIPDDLGITWNDVTLRLLDDSTLHVFVRKGKVEACNVRHFSQLTFTDRRSQDEERPGKLWLMLAGIIGHAASMIPEGQEVGGGIGGPELTFRLARGHGKDAEKARVTERKRVQELSDKLRRILGLDDENTPGPFEAIGTQQLRHVYKTNFRVGKTLKRERPGFWVPGEEVGPQKRK
jgi:hypothetical protein